MPDGVATSDATDDGDGNAVVKHEYYSAPVLQNFRTLNHESVANETEEA